LSSPPTAVARPVTSTYYGTRVVDPYRYLETLDDPEVKFWMKSETEYTQAILNSLPGPAKTMGRPPSIDNTIPSSQLKSAVLIRAR
jgi:prolyl oligopeptidase